jgi:hypothetical protein
MALAVEASASQTCTVTTTHTLSSPTSNKTRCILFDLGTSVSGDVFRIDILVKVLTGGTAAIAYSATYSNALGEPIVISPPIPMFWGGIFKITQTTGTSRTIPWELLTLD